MSARFHKTTIAVEILTTKPINQEDLEDAQSGIDDLVNSLSCDFSATSSVDTSEVSEAEVRELCTKHGSGALYRLGLPELDASPVVVARYRVVGTLCETRTYDVDEVVSVPSPAEGHEHAALSAAMGAVLPPGASNKAANFEWLDGPSVRALDGNP